MSLCAQDQQHCPREPASFLSGLAEYSPLRSASLSGLILKTVFQILISNAASSGRRSHAVPVTFKDHGTVVDESDWEP